MCPDKYQISNVEPPEPWWEEAKPASHSFFQAVCFVVANRGSMLIRDCSSILRQLWGEGEYANISQMIKGGRGGSHQNDPMIASQMLDLDSIDGIIYSEIWVYQF